MDKLVRPATPRPFLPAPTTTLGAHAEVALAMPELLSLLGQELNAPTEGLLGAVGLLLETDLSEEQRTYADKAKRAAQALLTIINNIHDFSKMGSGEIHLESIDFDLHAAVAQVAESFKNSADSRVAEMTFLVHHDVPAMVRGDPSRLRQILTTFLPYALQFTGDKAISLRAQVIPGAEDEVMVRFEVAQNDRGVILEWPGSAVQSPPQKELEYQRKPSGAGLGVAISKRLSELIGGQFGVETKPDKRSIAWVSIRLGKPSKQDSNPPNPRADLRGLSVLAVVDNQAAHQNLVAQTLSWGMNCDVAQSAPQALEMLRAGQARGQPYDLAILDMQIPGLDGLDLARAIQGDPTLSSVRPVVLIAIGLRGHAEESRRAGVAGYLTKPVDQSELYHCLTTVMGVQDGSSDAQTRLRAPLVTSHSLREIRALRAPRVLVAEDNPVNQMVAVRMLEKLGVQVDVAATGLAAAEACQRISYDLVLMDCQMPEMDGFEATRLILDSESARGGVHIPIAAVTANAMQGDRQKCLAAGMDDYIAKPFNLEQIRKLLERWVPALSCSDSPSLTSAASGQDMAVDTTALEGLQVRQEGGVPDFLAGLIGEFLPEARSRLAAIHEAVQSTDATALIQAAHSLKGSSAVMGAKIMATLCAELEDCARRTEMKDAAMLASQLENEFGRVAEQLEAKQLR